VSKFSSISLASTIRRALNGEESLDVRSKKLACHLTPRMPRGAKIKDS